MMNIFLKTPIAILFLFIAGNISAQDSAKETFLKATSVLTTENVEMIMAIDATDNKGRVKSKELTVWMAKFDAVDKTKVVFEKPERAKGTTIIITEEPGQIGVIEVFTPSNGKTRKLRATDSNMKMMGADFNMAGFANYNAAELNFEMRGDTIIGGAECNRIEVSGNAKNHTSALIVIDKESNLILQTTRFDEKHKPLSFTQLFEYQKVDGDPGKMYPMHIETESYDNNKEVSIRIMEMNIITDLSESIFQL